jgi:hypothetical protein
MYMSPAGLGTKNDCAGEGQQQFTRQTESVSEPEVTPSKGGMSSSPSLPPVEEEVPFRNT